MKILAIEFSSPQRSVAVLTVRERRERLVETVESGPDTRAFAMIDSVLAESGFEREQIEWIAVGLGPGSYTGIRTAIALSQGWQLARTGARVTGVSSADVLAHEAWERGLRGRAHVVIDAQRNEIYLGAYQLAGDGTATSTEPLRIAQIAEAAALAASGEIVTGPEAAKWIPRSVPLFPRAATLARIAARRLAAGEDPPIMEPIYLREPQFVKTPKPRAIPEFDSHWP